MHVCNPMALLKKYYTCIITVQTLLQFHKHVHRINQFNISIFFSCSLEKKKKVPSMDLSNFFLLSRLYPISIRVLLRKRAAKKKLTIKNDMKNEQRMLYNEFYILARDSVYCIRVHVCVYVWL